MTKLKIDSPFFRWMGRLGDVVVLNLLWLLASLPVVTLGASTAALYHVARKMALGEPCRVLQDFVHGLRQNGKQATLAWLILLAGGCLAAADLVIGIYTPGGFGSLCRGIGLVLCLLWLALFVHLFPLLARYDYPLRQLFATALALGVRKLSITLTGMLLIGWFPLLAVGSVEVAVYLFPFWLLLGGGVTALVVSTLYAPVFQQLECKKEER